MPSVPAIISPTPTLTQILQYILIPMFTATFEEGKGDELLGGAPDPEHDNDENIISVFINKVINPDKPFGSSVSFLTKVFACVRTSTRLITRKCSILFASLPIKLCIIQYFSHCQDNKRVMLYHRFVAPLVNMPRCASEYSLCVCLSV